MSDELATVQLTQIENYRFTADYGTAGQITVDEDAPLGGGQGPSPVQSLATAVGSCLSASLLFALRKFKQAPEPIRCAMQATVGRNAEKRLRVLGLQARLELGVPASSLEHLDRVLASFESYCTVTESVRAAIPVTVEVVDATGLRLK